MEKNIDSLIKEALKMRYDGIICPPSDKVWENVLKRLKEQQRKEKLRRCRPIAIACVSCVVVLLSFINFYEPAVSFANRFIKSVEEFTQDTLRIHKKAVVNGNGKAEADEVRIFDDPRLGEAQKKVNFTLHIPAYIPKGFELNKVDVLNDNKEREIIIFIYRNIEKEKEKEFIQIMQQSIPDGKDLTINIRKDDGTRIKHMKLDGIEYTLVNYEEKLNKLLWDSGNVSYKIDASLNEKEIVKIAKSMK